MKKKRNSVAARIVAGILVAVVVAGGCMAWSWLSDNKLPNVRKPVELYVRPDTAPEDILAVLDTCVARPGSLRRAFEEHKVAQYLTPGHYSVEKGQTSAYITRMLNNGWQTPVKLRIPGARLKGSLARAISSQMMVDSATVADALGNPDLLGRYGFTPETAFSLFIPDTYEMYWTDSVDEIFARQKKAWDAFWTEENVAKARGLGLSKLEVSILASIVKGESNRPEDYPKLAGVYINRLRKDMKLQSCPTVAFLFDYTKNRILTADLRTESPYNTYIHAGLPPGPISVPDKPYLNAVLNPDTADGYLFFCADPSFNGLHRFARTFSEHSRNAKEYQRAFDLRNKK
jgi:UPF0755 protein